MIELPTPSIDPRIRRRLKLRDLDTLLAVAQCGSMAKAATRLAVSQPAVSKAIADMEQTLGVRLFDRTAQGVEPTRYGLALLKWAVAVFDDIRQGVTEIGFLADPMAGELRIGATESMMLGFLPAVLARLCRRYPRIVFHVTYTTTVADQHRMLRERNVDLIVGRVAPIRTGDIIAVDILFDDPLFVVAGAQNPLVHRRKLQLADLLDESWTLPGADTVVGAHMSEAFRVIGLALPRSVVTCASIQMHLVLLKNRPFLALFPRSVLRFGAYRDSIKILPVTLPSSSPPVGILTLKNRTISPIAKLFIKCAYETAKPLTKIRSPRTEA